MLNWLHRFLYGDKEDAIVRVAAGLVEYEARMWAELLENNGIPAMVKNVGGGLLAEFAQPISRRPDFDVFVRRSDAKSAHELLDELLLPAQIAPEA